MYMQKLPAMLETHHVEWDKRQFLGSRQDSSSKQDDDKMYIFM